MSPQWSCLQTSRDNAKLTVKHGAIVDKVTIAVGGLDLVVKGLTLAAHGEHKVAGDGGAFADEEEALARAKLAENKLGRLAVELAVEPQVVAVLQRLGRYVAALGVPKELAGLRLSGGGGEERVQSSEFRALKVIWVWTRAEYPPHTHLGKTSCNVARRLVVCGAGVRVCAGNDQQADDSIVAGSGGMVQRGPALLVAGIQVCDQAPVVLIAQQLLDNL